MPAGRVVDVDGKKAPLIIMRIEQRQLLVAMHRVGGVVDIKRDRLWRHRMAPAPQIDQAMRQPDQGTKIWRVLQSRQRWLRGQIGATVRQPVACHLERGIGAQRVEVVAVRVAARDGEHTRAHHVGDGMADLSGIAIIREQSGQGVDQAKAPVGGGEQEHTAVRTDRATIERGGDFLLADVWQRERKQGIVISGGHGGFCPAFEDGVSNQSLSDSSQLHHARLRIPAMR